MKTLTSYKEQRVYKCLQLAKEQREFADMYLRFAVRTEQAILDGEDVRYTVIGGHPWDIPVSKLVGYYLHLATKRESHALYLESEAALNSGEDAIQAWINP